ncbi:TPA: hypothetical protein ACYZWS_004714 [Escherichia coli]
MRELNKREISAVAGGNAAEDGASIGGAIGSVIDDAAGILGIKLHAKDVLSTIGKFIGGVVDHFHPHKPAAIAKQ